MLVSFVAGEVLPVHVELPCQEERFADLLNRIVSVGAQRWHELGFSDEQIQLMGSLLLILKATIYFAEPTGSVLILMHCETAEVLDHLWHLFESQQLAKIIKQLFQCLTSEDVQSVVINIAEEDYVACKEGFTTTGMHS